MNNKLDKMLTIGTPNKELSDVIKSHQFVGHAERCKRGDA